jgi:hypothetical protein
MYGFDVSGLIQQSVQLPVGEIGAYWCSPFRILNAECGWLYWVGLNIKYGTNSMPAPNLTDSLVIIEEGQQLQCMVNLVSGVAGLQHPVGCTITDNSGTVVFTHNQWVTVTYEENDIWVDFFEGVSLVPGAYTVSWGVCGASSSHGLTVHALQNYTTNNIDVSIVVTDTAGVDAYAVWDAIDTDVAAEMLVYNATVNLRSAEVIPGEMGGTGLIVFHLEATAPIETSVGSVGVIPIVPIICWAIVAAIAFFLVGLPAIAQIKVAEFEYNVSMRQFVTPDGKYMYYEDYCGYMATNYPDVWDDIKEHVKRPVPEPDWMDYIMYAVIAIFGLAGLYVSIKYVFPALKGR